MKETKRLISALAVLLGIAGIFILYLSFPLISGKTVILKTKPIDPFDIFRGQYITINYELSSVPSIQGAKENDVVYIYLKKNEDGTRNYNGASLIKPISGTFIQGKIGYNDGDVMVLDYGIEQYFFERNAELPRINLSVEVKLGSSGQARISQLLYNNKPVKVKYKNLSITS